MICIFTINPPKSLICCTLRIEVREYGAQMTRMSLSTGAGRSSNLSLIVILVAMCNLNGVAQQTPPPIVQGSPGSIQTGPVIIDPVSIAPLIAPGDAILSANAQQFQIQDTVLELVDFREQPLGEAMRLFSEQSGLNIVASATANTTPVNLYLRDVKAMDVLENLTKTHDLYYRVDEESGVIRIYTTEEYEQNLASFREERTKVFTLLYPNPTDAAVAIRDLFGDRVELNFGVGDQDSILDLVYRLNRFDLVDSRSLGLGAFQGNYAYGGRSFSRLNGLGGFTGGNNSLVKGGGGNQTEFAPLSDLSAEQIQQLIDAVNSRGGPNGEEATDPTDPIAQLMKERQATIYVTVIRRNNQVVVRTGDDETMKQIEQLIQNLDVPTPLVLLEVKVMSILLDDDFRSVFDYQFSDGANAGSFTTGDILQTPADSIMGEARRLASMVPGGSVLNQGDFTFQYVNNNFRMRMQLLEDDNRVTILNTPLLLTANNEVSRIFIGDTIPFTVGFNSPQVISGGGAGNTTIAGTPITELRDVGQSLLITPSINADRTVTLRVVQENARRVINGGRIPILNTQGVITNQEVDTVNRSTVSGTVVAKDGLAVVLGGLIENEIRDNRQQVPGIGKLPVLGFFFRNQETGRTRRELVVMIRPYVFNTPSESASISQELLQQLSVHPAAIGDESSMNTFSANEVIRPDLDCNRLCNEFRFHNVVPNRY